MNNLIVKLRLQSIHNSIKKKGLGMNLTKVQYLYRESYKILLRESKWRTPHLWFRRLIIDCNSPYIDL